METTGEVTLKDIVEILKRNRTLLWAVPLVIGVLALIYSFFIAQPRYASTATVSVSPLQVQAQLEQRIQVQQSPLLTFDGLKAIAYSEEVLSEVWNALKKEGKLPTAWQDRGNIRGLEGMAKDFKMKDRTPKQLTVPQGQTPPLVAEMSVQAPSPEVAAKAANLWAQATIARVNEIPLGRLKASLAALEEQIPQAEKTYREAQARWEAFTRATTLAQDKAELDAKTGERVGLDTELAGLERDLAAVQGRIQAVEKEVAKQAGIVPLGTGLDQIVLSNQRLEAAKARLKAEVDKAERAYREAARALEAFKGKERIPQWGAELSAYTEAFASVQVRILAIAKELATQKSLLAEAEARLAEYKAQLPGISLESLVSGMKVEEAKALLDGRLEEAEKRYGQAEARYRDFQKRNELGVLKAQLSEFTGRASAIAARLNTLATERSTKEARLQVVEDQLAQEPRLLALEREIAADPAALAAAVQEGGLKGLVGLRLKNQELNPTHQSLLNQALGLRADLVTLAKEEEALKGEQARLLAEIDRLKDRIAGLELEQARVLTELEVARDQYNAVYRYHQNVLTLAAEGVEDKGLREVNPDVLAFRDKVVGIRAQIAALEAERAALERNLKTYEDRIASLKARIAAQEQEKDRVGLEYGSQRAIYETLKNRYEQIAKLDAPGIAFDNPNPEYQRLRSVLIDAQAEEARLLARRSALLNRIAQVDTRIQALKARVAQAQVEQDKVNQALELAKNAYLALSQKKTDLQIELASSQNALAQVLAPAYPIYEKVWPKRGLILALALVLGFFIAVVGAFVVEALGPRGEALRKPV
ncbi:MAG: Wzz/FepE/Etk N-terminal domain-containing protein [Thermaceae bacterium]